MMLPCRRSFLVSIICIVNFAVAVTTTTTAATTTTGFVPVRTFGGTQCKPSTGRLPRRLAGGQGGLGGRPFLTFPHEKSTKYLLAVGGGGIDPNDIVHHIQSTSDQLHTLGDVIVNAAASHGHHHDAAAAAAAAASSSSSSSVPSIGNHEHLTALLSTMYSGVVAKGHSQANILGIPIGHVDPYLLKEQSIVPLSGESVNNANDVRESVGSLSASLAPSMGGSAATAGAGAGAAAATSSSSAAAATATTAATTTTDITGPIVDSTKILQMDKTLPGFQNTGSLGGGSSSPTMNANENRAELISLTTPFTKNELDEELKLDSLLGSIPDAALLYALLEFFVLKPWENTFRADIDEDKSGVVLESIVSILLRVGAFFVIGLVIIFFSDMTYHSPL